MRQEKKKKKKNINSNGNGSKYREAPLLPLTRHHAHRGHGGDGVGAVVECVLGQSFGLAYDRGADVHDEVQALQREKRKKPQEKKKQKC